MNLSILSSFFLYFLCIFSIACVLHKKKQTASNFILGDRSLNYWVTALAAHASEMSSWLFIGFPSMIFLYGIEKISIAIGLIIFMFANWHLVARKVRVATEKMGSLTFFSYLGERFQDHSGSLRVFSSLLCAFFYILYIAVGLMGLGIVLESIFPLSYGQGVLIATVITVPYVLAGGYTTLAWIDLFQGLFLMAAIVFVPFFLLGKLGGFSSLSHATASPLLALPSFTFSHILGTIGLMLSWGLGYFGQPTIITKFMGIKHAAEISKSKIVGMSWMTISLSAAALVGMVAWPFFQGRDIDPQMLFITMVKESFHPFWMGLILCAVIAASLNVMSSQILVLCSSFAEDIYKKKIRPHASSRQVLRFSKAMTIVIASIAFIIAYGKTSTVYTLVLYAWSGLGSSFGPILLFSLYSKKSKTSIAWAGIIAGGLSSAIWPWLGITSIDPMLVGVTCSFIAIAIAAKKS